VRRPIIHGGVALAVAVIAAIAVWGGRALLTGAGGSDLDAVIAACERQDFADAEQRLQRMRLDEKQAGAALAAQGYLASSRGDSTAALPLYRRAIETDPAIAAHQVIVDDVIAYLEDYPAAAIAIIALCEPAVARAGLRHTVADSGIGYAGRLAAARLLVERGQDEREPVQALAREVLLRAADCQQRKLAIELLADVGDGSDLAALEALVDGYAPVDGGAELLAQIGRQLQRNARDFCLADAPRKAIERIRGRS
jgi:hypothetical protein